MVKLRLVRRKIHNNPQHSPNASLLTRDHLLSRTLKLIKYYLLSRMLEEIKRTEQEKIGYFQKTLQLTQEVLQIHKDYPQEASQVYRETLSLLDDSLHSLRVPFNVEQRPSSPPPQIFKARKVKKIHQKKKNEKLLEEFISSINGVKARIHRLTLFGDYIRQDLKERIGPLNYLGSPGERRSNYRAWRVKQLPHDRKVSIFTQPKVMNPRAPARCLVEIPDTFPQDEFLLNLCDLRMSKMELAFDLFGGGPEWLRALRKEMERYLFIPNAVDTKLYEEPGQNATRLYTGKIKVGEQFTKYGQLYERGPDCLKGKGKSEEGWDLKDISWLRLEINLSLYRIRNWLGIETVGDFVTKFSFKRAIMGTFDFRRPKDRTRSFPREFDCLMDEYNKLKGHKGQSPSKHLIIAEEMEPLMQKLIDAMERYDIEKSDLSGLSKEIY